MVYSIYSVPSGWTRHIQPEGQPYYVKSRNGRRTYLTDIDITKLENMDRMQHHMDDMEVRISNHANDLPEKFQICLDPHSHSEAAYYMVNHDRGHGCIFWIDKLDLPQYTYHGIGLHSLSHWRTCLHNQFSVLSDFTCRAL